MCMLRLDGFDVLTFSSRLEEAIPAGTSASTPVIFR
jgi:hypothetical protein